jgi:YVTN family beta-propeller protein
VSQAASSSIDPTPPQYAQAPRRRIRLLAVAGTAVLTAATLGFIALTGERPDEGTADTVRTAHTGMVTGTVWVANEDGGTLTAIDAATNQVATTLDGIDGPHNVQIGPDGASLWTVSGHDSFAAMLDTPSMELHGAVPTGGSPAHVVVTPDGATAYTTNAADGTVTAIDTATMRAVATIPAGAGPHGLRPSPDGRWIYVANVSGTTLSVIDTTTNTLVDDIVVGRAPAQVAFSPDGRFLYASLNGEDAVAKVDVERRRLVGKVTVGNGPIQTFVTPDNRFLLVANQGDEQDPGTTVSLIDIASFTLTKDIETGEGAHGIVVEPSGRHAYVTNLYGNDVAVLDLDTLDVVARIPVGDKPNGISFSPVAVERQPTTMLHLPDAPSGEPGEHSNDAGHDQGTH